MSRTKLPIQARLIRAGIYALLVAMSYWVCCLYRKMVMAKVIVDVGSYDL